MSRKYLLSVLLGFFLISTALQAQSIRCIPGLNCPEDRSTSPEVNEPQERSPHTQQQRGPEPRYEPPSSGPGRRLQVCPLEPVNNSVYSILVPLFGGALRFGWFDGSTSSCATISDVPQGGTDVYIAELINYGWKFQSRYIDQFQSEVCASGGPQMGNTGGIMHFLFTHPHWTGRQGCQKSEIGFYMKTSPSMPSTRFRIQWQ